MGMNDAFFRDTGQGNYYQGTARNVSGEMYDPSKYGGLRAYNPKEPDNLTNIGPNSYGGNQMQTLASLGYGGMAMPFQTGGIQSGGSQRAMQYGSPQSGYSYTLADLLRNYYA